jgi:hypothetical protein
MDAPSLARRLAALPALAMRRASLRETLEALSADEAARLCGELVRRGRDGAPFDSALLAFSALLDGGDLGYERHGELYAAARMLGDQRLTQLLLSAEPPPPGTPAPPVLPDQPELTLGERKSLARGHRREILDRLLADPDEAVLAILLGNPRLTESDVVRVAARRPTSPAAQRVIFASERFIHRYAVKRALAFNPYTPSDLAARLLPLLTQVDLRHVAEAPGLADQVRRSARELLRRAER